MLTFPLADLPVGKERWRLGSPSHPSPGLCKPCSPCLSSQGHHTSPWLSWRPSPTPNSLQLTDVFSILGAQNDRQCWMWSNGCWVEGGNQSPQSVSCSCSSHQGYSWSSLLLEHAMASRPARCPPWPPGSLPAELLPCQAVPSLCPARSSSTQAAGLYPCWISWGSCWLIPLACPGPCGQLPCPLVCQVHHLSLVSSGKPMGTHSFSLLSHW